MLLSRPVQHAGHAYTGQLVHLSVTGQPGVYSTSMASFRAPGTMMSQTGRSLLASRQSGRRVPLGSPPACPPPPSAGSSLAKFMNKNSSASASSLVLRCCVPLPAAPAVLPTAGLLSWLPPSASVEQPCECSKRVDTSGLQSRAQVCNGRSPMVCVCTKIWKRQPAGSAQIRGRTHCDNLTLCRALVGCHNKRTFTCGRQGVMHRLDLGQCAAQRVLNVVPAHRCVRVAGTAQQRWVRANHLVRLAAVLEHRDAVSAHPATQQSTLQRLLSGVRGVCAHALTAGLLLRPVPPPFHSSPSPTPKL